MWKRNYPHVNAFCPEQGDRLKIWQEEDSGNWTTLEGVIERVERFNYESRKEVEPYFGDDPTYLWGEDQPDAGICIAIRCDLVPAGETDECPLKNPRRSWQKLPA